MPANGMLFLHALTGLHPGSGTALGIVDLPVQRERHTQWPLIPATSLKGVLREAFRPGTGQHGSESWLGLFGPETPQAKDHAGALALTDARILAFPVRSLRGVFAWVTCPAVLDRFSRDLGLTGIPGWTGGIPDLRATGSSSMLCAEDSPVLVSGSEAGRQALLEEFEFTRTGDAPAIRQWIAQRAAIDAHASRRLASHLVILADDDFTHFVRYATEITARIGLDYTTRTVKNGALFYQEFLPPETLLYSLVLAQDSRRQGWQQAAAEVLAAFTAGLPATLQIGADETTGKGLCGTRLHSGAEAGAGR